MKTATNAERATLLRPATRQELEAALARMERDQHVNQNAVLGALLDLKCPGAPFPLLVIGLRWLETGSMGWTFQQYLASHGITGAEHERARKAVRDAKRRQAAEDARLRERYAGARLELTAAGRAALLEETAQAHGIRPVEAIL